MLHGRLTRSGGAAYGKETEKRKKRKGIEGGARERQREKKEENRCEGKEGEKVERKSVMEEVEER